MSKVIGFRLDRNNPREAQALQVLVRWQESGFSTRHILTEALLRLEHSGKGDEKDLQFDEISGLLHQVREQLERIQSSNLHLSNAAPEKVLILSDAFLGSVRQTARPGMQLNE